MGVRTGRGRRLPCRLSTFLTSSGLRRGRHRRRRRRLDNQPDVIPRGLRLRPDVDVDVLQVGVTISEEEGAYGHHRDNRQADDEEQRQPSEAQVVARPDLLVKEQLESAAPRITT